MYRIDGTDKVVVVSDSFEVVDFNLQEERLDGHIVYTGSVTFYDSMTPTVACNISFTGATEKTLAEWGFYVKEK